ncbi:ketopantoate reductase family protein [Hymenobacter chitinivorans]|uniref:2-dehydropantoate 2-reductase n=1 Tax=Hymenobacter chitinivorans DSM 11115 TaxID=1121954 RepID=A0A2M9BNG7_9BACT|nr:2-dehydropantoate 2-reductase [Hymenobacter chitinivorans]PJJ59488.1 2-dehydropantoate 2-reductase [Hymenobacter chitinivorans DSM 11115]
MNFQQQPFELAVVGLGGVGGYFGFKLAQYYAESAAVRVTFIARGATYAAVRRQGLTLLSPEHTDSVAHPAQVLATVAELPTVDLLLLCVKEYDLEDLCRQLRPELPAGTVILPLMNGVDIYERIRRQLPQVIILPACVYVASHLQSPGVVEHRGNPGSIIVGQDPQHPSFNPTPLLKQLTAAGIQLEYQTDAFPAIWTKFFFIASFGLVSARYNQSIGQVHENPVLHARARRLMQEIAAIAQAKGIALPPDLIERTFQKAATFPYHTPTSLQLDVHAGKARTELELFAGAILSYGAALDLPVPETRTIYQEIQAQLAATEPPQAPVAPS